MRSAPLAAPPAPLRPVLAVVRRPLVAAVLLGFVYLACARLCLAIPRDTGRVAPIWIANAVALAVLLRTDTRRWPGLVAACLTANVVASVWGGNLLPTPLPFAACNAAEYLGVAALLRWRLGREYRLEERRHVAELIGWGLAVTLAMSVVQAVALHLLLGDPVAAGVRTWGMGHPLSLLLGSICLLSLGKADAPPLSLRALLIFAVGPGCAWLVFAQTRFPILFLIPPALLLVSLELGVAAAAAAVLMTGLIAVPLTALGYGPVALSRGDGVEKAALLQLFLTVALFSSLPVAALQARQKASRRAAVEGMEAARRAEAAANRSEAHYRTLADEASDAIGSMNMRGELTYLSPAIFEITGYTAEELLHTHLAAHIDPRDYPEVAANFRAIVASDKAAGVPIEYRFRRKDGQVIWLQANPRVVFDEAGAPLGTVDVVRDITARRTMEEQLREARTAAEDASRAKSDFLANMSHELRTPLGGILGYAELLRREGETSPAGRRYAELIGGAGANLLALVNDVLELSKVEAGAVELEQRPLELADLLRSTLDLLRPAAGAKRLALDLDLPREPVHVMGDAVRLGQVLMNLLGNAVKFTDRGLVGLSLRAVRSEDVWSCRFSVSDTGLGIRADRLERVFRRFEQADGSITRRFGGTGLGLAIVQGLVDAMGGRIDVESAEGAGSVFTVRLDLPAATPAPAALPAAQPPGPAAPRPLEGLDVLLAEDVEMNRELVRLFLEPAGVRLTTARDGLEAVELAAARPFDVILMDMQMPKLDGLAATRRIRGEGGPNAGVPIVALTANMLDAEIARCRAAGMDDHLGKPFDAAALKAALGAVRRRGLDEPAAAAA